LRFNVKTYLHLPGGRKVVQHFFRSAEQVVAGTETGVNLSHESNCDVLQSELMMMGGLRTEVIITRAG